MQQEWKYQMKLAVSNSYKALSVRAKFWTSQTIYVYFLVLTIVVCSSQFIVGFISQIFNQCRYRKHHWWALITNNLRPVVIKQDPAIFPTPTEDNSTKPCFQNDQFPIWQPKGPAKCNLKDIVTDIRACWFCTKPQSTPTIHTRVHIWKEQSYVICSLCKVLYMVMKVNWSLLEGTKLHNLLNN